MKLSMPSQTKASRNASRNVAEQSLRVTEVSAESCGVKEDVGFNSEAWFATPELRASSRGMLLEISVTWQDILLDIAHYRHPRRITFGSHPRADFCYSLFSSLEPLHKVSPFPLIEASRSGEYLICFDSEMNGTVDENGEQWSFLDLVKEGRAHSFSRHGLFYYSLQPGATVSLACYEHTQIQIRFVSAPPLSQTWFGYLDTHAPVLSFSILIHLLMTCMAILSLASSPQSSSRQPTPRVQSTASGSGASKTPSRTRSASPVVQPAASR